MTQLSFPNEDRAKVAKGEKIIQTTTNMSVVTWDVRGLNKAYKQQELKGFIKEKKVVLLAIIEHRMNEDK